MRSLSKTCAVIKLRLRNGSAHPVYQVAFVLAIRKPPADYLEQDHSKGKRVALDVHVLILGRVPARERGFVVEVAERLLMSRKQHFPALKVDQLLFISPS